MRVICLTCGLGVQLGDSYDEYEGPVRCFACRAMLQVRCADGNLKEVSLLPSPDAPAAEASGGVSGSRG